MVETDATLVQDHAKRMLAELEDTEVATEIATAARQIATTNDVNVQRDAFSDLTAAMEPVLDEALTSGEVYKQFCPMAFEGKGGYWLSNSKEIRNPYYGDKMLKCGRVEATLK